MLIHAASASPAPGAVRAASPEEAAAQFEALLVRQMVQIMTRELFRDAGGVSAQADLQQDALVNVLTERLVAADVLRVRDVLVRQWDREGALPHGAPAGRAAAARRPDPLAPDAYRPLPGGARTPGAPYASNLFGTSAYRPFGTDHLEPAAREAAYALPYNRARLATAPAADPEPRPGSAAARPGRPAPVTRDRAEALREHESHYLYYEE
ncbi:MAG: hypothetical protein ACK41D_02230 [Rubricoccaceae bacterium]